ncbi:MAG: hypothetical protein KJZ78_29315 [Bryobacteraceae bacterium]|nr:hypothetical protein [Bryobacteraceae bacterium]
MSAPHNLQYVSSGGSSSPSNCTSDSSSASPEAKDPGNGNLVDIDVLTGDCSGSDGPGSLINADVGGGNGTGSLVVVDVAADDSGPLISAQVAGGSVLDASVDADDYSGISLKVAALADQGLLGDGDLSGDGLVSLDVGDHLPVDGVGSLLDLGNIGLPDLPDIGGILDPASC